MNNSETEAIVLDSRDHGESDKIITFFSTDNGRFTGIAKGANRSKKRFLNKLELFSQLTITFSERQHSSLAFISDAELNSSFIHLRSNVTCYTAATFLREVLLIALPERQGDANLFTLVCWAFASLNQQKNQLAILTVFLIRLYDRLGYCPDLSGWKNCGIPFTTGQTFSFDNSSGSLLCTACLAQQTEHCISLSLGTIGLLRSSLSSPIERLHRLQFSRHALNQALPMLHRYGRNLFQRENHSWKPIQKMLKTS